MTRLEFRKALLKAKTAERSYEEAAADLHTQGIDITADDLREEIYEMWRDA